MMLSYFYTCIEMYELISILYCSSFIDGRTSYVESESRVPDLALEIKHWPTYSVIFTRD